MSYKSRTVTLSFVWGNLFAIAVWSSNLTFPSLSTSWHGLARKTFVLSCQWSSRATEVQTNAVRWLLNVRFEVVTHGLLNRRTLRVLPYFDFSVIRELWKSFCRRIQAEKVVPKNAWYCNTYSDWNHIVLNYCLYRLIVLMLRKLCTVQHNMCTGKSKILRT